VNPYLVAAAAGVALLLFLSRGQQAPAVTVEGGGSGGAPSSDSGGAGGVAVVPPGPQPGGEISPVTSSGFSTAGTDATSGAVVDSISAEPSFSVSPSPDLSAPVQPVAFQPSSQYVVGTNQPVPSSWTINPGSLPTVGPLQVPVLAQVATLPQVGAPGKGGGLAVA
jgi:hypothetical protein